MLAEDQRNGDGSAGYRQAVEMPHRRGWLMLQTAYSLEKGLLCKTH